MYPTLFHKTSTGAIQQWTIEAKGNEIHVEFGQVGGKLQTTVDTIREGKNIGRANETTPEQQAQSEVQSQWEKRKKKGYVESIEAAKADQVDSDMIAGGLLPMLAKKYSEDSKKIKWPALTQPKFDGIRCVAILKDGVCTLWSRTRKLITGVPHVAREVERCFPGQNIVLDGELYQHDYKNEFEKIVSFVRQETPKTGHEVVQYHVYDVVNDLTNAGRSDWLIRTLPVDSPIIRRVATYQVDSEEELMSYFERFLVEGYEGAMVRNMEGKYVNKRSADLQKVKPHDDAEFKIVGVAEGRGKLQGHAATFLCEMDDGKPFEAKMRGAQSKLKEYFENHSLWTGKKLTVKYQGLTSANGVPRFPVGVRIREDE